MVISGRRTAEEREDLMTPPRDNFATAMDSERSRSSLHNFSLPCFKWGEQRQPRRVKVDDDGAVGGGGGHSRGFSRRSQPTNSNPCRVSGFEPRKPPESNKKKRSISETESFERSKSRFQSSPPLSEGGEGIEAVRKKIILDLRTHMDRMKSVVLSDGTEVIEPPPTMTEAPPAEEARPWNLRTRRAACKEPNLNGGTAGKSQGVDERKSKFSPAKSSVQSPARRSDVSGGDDVSIGGEKKTRAKFRVPLYKQEIEEDFIAMTGARPPRTLKKRSRNVQRQIDRLLPGLWLSEIKPSMYKVNENADAGKRQ